EEVSASQILISTLDKNKKEVSKDKKEALKKKADNILTKIKNGIGTSLFLSKTCIINLCIIIYITPLS
ncbi:peptidylprolyl isomerase, partial [Clostridioides difficile]